MTFYRKANPSAPLLALLLILSACGKTELKVYLVPKEEAQPPSSSRANNGTNASLAISSATPSSWKTLAPTAIRKANYVYTNRRGEETHITLSSIPGSTGSLLAHLNLWRTEIDLPPIESTDLAAVIDINSRNGIETRETDLRHANPSPDQQRIIASVFSHSGHTWFFKMIGPHDDVESQKSNFNQFLNTIIGESIRATQPAETPKEKQLAYTAPADWIATVPKPPRIANLIVEKEDFPPAEFSIVEHELAHGSLVDEVNRWRRHINLNPWTQAQLDNRRQKIASAELEFTYFDFKPESNEEKAIAPQRMLLAFLDKDDKRWLFRFIGDPFLIETQRIKFHQLIRSCRFELPQNPAAYQPSATPQ